MESGIRLTQSSLADCEASARRVTGVAHRPEAGPVGVKLPRSAYSRMEHHGLRKDGRLLGKWLPHPSANVFGATLWFVIGRHRPAPGRRLAQTNLPPFGRLHIGGLGVSCQLDTELPELWDTPSLRTWACWMG